MRTRCLPSCDEVERLNFPRKPTGQVTAQQAGLLDLDKLNRVGAPKIESVFVLYGGPPDRHKTVPTFNILRI